VLVDVRSQPVPGGHLVRFSVKDSGIGMTEEQVSKLFSAFSQADSTTTRRFGGTGLGLAISKQLVNMMGGDITIQSEVNKGTTFSFEVILPEAIEMPHQFHERSLAGMKVLVVDDHPINLEIISHQLQREGAIVHTANSGRQALAQLADANLANAPFSRAIIDMKMPEMNGIELIEEIRRRKTDSALRIVMLTSMGVEKDNAELKALGVTARLSKPIRRSELVRQLLDSNDTNERETADSSLSTHEKISDKPIEKYWAKILVAEDNPINQLLIKHFLKTFNCSFTLVENGALAVEANRNESFDLILMDCQMPEMDGFEATKLIRTAEQGLLPSNRIPIIALTANAIAGDRDICLNAGMDDYLSKPYSREQLKEMITRWLELRKNLAIQSNLSPQVKATSAQIRDIEPSTIHKLQEAEHTVSPHLMNQIAAIFLAEAPKKMNELAILIQKNDYSKVRMIVHSLKSNCLTLGALDLGEVFRDLEALAKTNSLEGAEKLLSIANNELLQVTPELQALQQQSTDAKHSTLTA
jgi:two-component system, sensor histidine kinase and response regulator